MTTHTIKMAAPSERDKDAAYELMNTLEAVNRSWWPDGMKLPDSGNEPDRFDEFDHEHLAALHAHLVHLMDEKAPGFMGRIIGGMCGVILNPDNKLVDLTSDTLDLHPDLKAAIAMHALAQQHADHIVDGNKMAPGAAAASAPADVQYWPPTTWPAWSAWKAFSMTARVGICQKNG